MTQVLFSGLGVRVVDWSFTAFALAGMLICLYTALDAHVDLRVRVRYGLNGTLEVAGRVARRSALASAGLHSGFLVVGVIALMAPLPAPDRYQRAVLTGTVFIAIQAIVVLAQIRSQLDRSALRRRNPAPARGRSREEIHQ